MKQGMKAAAWGIFLASFHINLFGIPIFPSIVGIVVWLEGLKKMEAAAAAEKENQEFLWGKWMRRAGMLLLFVTICGLAAGWLTEEENFWIRQIPALLMAAETVCGFSMMNFVEKELAFSLSEFRISHMPEWYLVFMMSALALYEYSAVEVSTGWNSAAAFAMTIGRILSLVFLCRSCSELPVQEPSEEKQPFLQLPAEDGDGDGKKDLQGAADDPCSQQEECRDQKDHK